MSTAARKKQIAPQPRNGAAAPLLKLVVSDNRPATARIVGYARVSRDDQNLDMQLALLRAAGVQQIFEEKISAVSAKRPQWNLCLKYLEPGDTLVFYAFNRLSRDLKQLLGLVDDMKAAGVKLHSVTEPHIDPFTTNGRLLVSVTGAVDENERGRIRDRTRDGMAEKKRQGMWLGRRPKFGPAQAKKIQRDRQTMSREAAARKWKCSAGTIKKYET